MIAYLQRALSTYLGLSKASHDFGLSSPPQVEPITLPGPWSRGIALGMHSESSPGSTDERTEIGLLLARFKYQGERRLARPLGEALAGAVQGLSFDLIVHVPSSRRSTYEPACELGRATARALRVRCLPHLLRLTRRISPQKDLVNQDGKWENVQGAFQVRRPEFVRGRRVLVVDDVYDSGATLGEACRALKAAGAADIAVAAVTKTRLTGSS